MLAAPGRGILPSMIVRRSVIAGLVLLAGCDGASDGAGAESVAGAACGEEMSLVLRPDVPSPGDEAYLCFGFDVPRVAAGAPLLQGIDVRAPPAGAVALHHTALFATAEAFPDGPVRCESMPESALELRVWAPGSGALELPDGVALALPDGAARLIVQAHVMRVDEGPASDVAVDLCTAAGRPEHVAAWMPARAPVPAIRPHHVETSTAACTVASPLHLLSVWPHMHRTGAEIHGALLGADGARRAIIDVVPWDAEDQRTYSIDLDTASGDRIETTCVWENPGADYVFPGPGIDDEMCSQSFVAWPREAAHCDEP